MTPNLPSMNAPAPPPLTRFEKLFTAFIVFIPILSYYKSPVSGMNSATFGALCFFAWFFIARPQPSRQRARFLSPAWLYMAFLSFNVVLTSFLYDYPLLDPRLLAIVRAFFLFFPILILGGKFFVFPQAVSMLEKLLIASVFWIGVQTVCARLLHHPVTGNIPFLVTHEAYKSAGTRPTGFYMETSEFAKNAIMYLCFTLFGKKALTPRQARKVLWVVAGIVLSGSGMGYALLLTGFVVWIFHNVVFKKMTTGKLLGGTVLIVILVGAGTAYLQTPMGQFALSRIVSEEEDGNLGRWGGQALSGRTFSNDAFYRLPDTKKRWGVGFGHVSDVIGQHYTNSLFSHLITCGYACIPVWLAMLGIIFWRGDMRIKVFSVVYAALLCISACGNPMGISYYFSFLLSGAVFTAKRGNREIESHA